MVDETWATANQRTRWSTTTVVGGVDAGSWLTVVVAPPGPSGLATILGRLPRSQVPLPVLASAIGDCVWVLGHAPPGSAATVWSALADRLVRYQEAFSPPRRPVLWCSADGRLTRAVKPVT